MMADELLQLMKLVGAGLGLLLPLANPLTSMSMLLSLGERIPRPELRRQISQGAIYVVLIMLVAYFGGSWITHALDISMPGLRVAGGLIVAFIGFKMLFPAGPASSDATSSLSTSKPVPNLAFVPLALPGTAGPGTIAMIISASSKMATGSTHYSEWVMVAAPIIVALVFGALFFICLRSADRLIKILGHDGIDAIGRLMGFLLVCIGVQLVIDGVQEIILHG